MEMDQYQNNMDPVCRKEMPDRQPVFKQDDYVQSTDTDPMSHHQAQYGQDSRSRSRSPLRRSSSPDQEPSTLKKQRLQVQAISEEEYDEGTSQYEGEEEEGYTDSKLRGGKSSKYDYEGEDESMSQSMQRSQNPGVLEKRLEQIKQNIKNQKGTNSSQDNVSDLMEKYSPNKG